jgi:hypothetical protein
MSVDRTIDRSIDFLLGTDDYRAQKIDQNVETLSRPYGNGVRAVEENDRLTMIVVL